MALRSKKYHTKKRDKRRAANELKFLARIKEALPIDLAWAAGFFEGEGTVAISFSRNRHARVHVTIANNDKQTLDFFQEHWSGCFYLRKRDKTKTKANDTWWWSINAIVQTDHFLKTVMPYLRTDRVRSKFRLALECNEFKFKHRSRDFEGYRERMLEFYMRMKLLNRRGRKA